MSILAAVALASLILSAFGVGFAIGYALRNSSSG
jgi:hypothetical protein